MMRASRVVAGTVLAAGLLVGGQGLRAASSAPVSEGPRPAIQQTQTGVPAREPASVGEDAMSPFRHVQHEDVQCVACHRMETAHGASSIRTVEDCRGCHHTGAAVRECAACHGDVGVQEQVFTVRSTFTLSVADVSTERELPFRHGQHEDLGCVQCHGDGPSLAVPDLDCQSCHEEHHAISVSGCLDCHREPASEVHELVVHATCSGSGCHEDVPVGSAPRAPRNRTGCLWCHQEQADHEPDVECVSCHLMPAPRPFEE